MGIQVVRFENNNTEQWGVLEGKRIKVLKENYSTLEDFLQNGQEEARKLLEDSSAETVSFDEVNVLSPVTKPARIVCQGANYSSHRAESGMEANRPPFNLIFSKADSTLTGAYSEIIRPSNVELLDYEIELGLVLGTNISEAVEVTDDNLHEYIAGIVLTNDVSARDVQLVEGQWLKGKSYRTFCPTGPIFYLLDKEEVSLIHDLELNLWVNDELRQSANTDQLLYKPAETLTELSQIMDFSKGDLVLSGTTGGVAMNLTPDLLKQVTDITQPAESKHQALVENQLRSGNKYLKDGDVVRASIKSKDGKIDLGEQRNVVASHTLVTAD
ncbi:fumarylacetoacetate hydrolase family protein [Oceanobacillus halophilus]|uniref:2-keto-4-pentenoate hydratase n=1 Tax=Oceanobacillus halophilus TaxID=930130 RepID=A0A494ZVA9_9BACI|nr:fumarylacetoacetate hydrolase family protein [Oceanobacillus halophilus]RKQ30379.1 2-keto-4-pentenoate hydratase [Oceanobacillus halophilus]